MAILHKVLLLIPMLIPFLARLNLVAQIKLMVLLAWERCLNMTLRIINITKELNFQLPLAFNQLVNFAITKIVFGE